MLELCGAEGGAYVLQVGGAVEDLQLPGGAEEPRGVTDHVLEVLVAARLDEQRHLRRVVAVAAVAAVAAVVAVVVVVVIVVVVVVPSDEGGAT